MSLYSCSDAHCSCTGCHLADFLHPALYFNLRTAPKQLALSYLTVRQTLQQCQALPARLFCVDFICFVHPCAQQRTATCITACTLHRNHHTILELVLQCVNHTCNVQNHALHALPCKLHLHCIDYTGMQTYTTLIYEAYSPHVPQKAQLCQGHPAVSAARHMLCYLVSSTCTLTLGQNACKVCVHTGKC